MGGVCLGEGKREVMDKVVFSEMMEEESRTRYTPFSKRFCWIGVDRLG